MTINFMTMSKKLSQVLLSLGLITAPIFANTAMANDNALLLQQATLTAKDAINTATSRVSGDVVDVGFDDDLGGVFELKVIRGNTKHDIEINAQTGNIIKHKQKRLDRSDRREYQAFKRAKISLDNAMERAIQAAGGGQVLAIEFDNNRHLSLYEVKVVNDGLVHKISLHADNGTILEQTLDD